MLCRKMLSLRKFSGIKLGFSTHFHRHHSFKVLNGKLNYEDSMLHSLKEKASFANNALDILSNFAKSGGGKKGIHRHTVINKKLLPRHRLKLLFDPDSPFLEIGLLAGFCMDYGTIPAASAVAGIGKIHGRFCIVNVNDATVKGGAFFPITIVKTIRLQKLSYLNNLPCFYLVDSGGGFLPLQADIFPDKEHGGRTFYNEAVLSSKGIPQVAAVCGSSTAGGAYCPTMAEEAIIVKESGIIFLGGPPLVKAATGEIVNEQDLGGADLHCSISGCTDYYAEDEENAFEMCRESVLTFNIPKVSEKSDYQEPLYPSEDLSLISGKSHFTKEDLYMILARILDGSMFKEFKKRFGEHLITGFGFINGLIVGILANCDTLTYQDAQKGSHFIQICGKRNIPLIFLQSSGLHSELYDESQISILRDKAAMVSAHCNCGVPKISICLNGCFGDDNFTMCGWAFEPNFFFSWPLAHVSLSRKDSEKEITSIETHIKELNGSKNIDDYEKLFENKSCAFSHASNMISDGIIKPHDTREVLRLCLQMATANLALRC